MYTSIKLCKMSEISNSNSINSSDDNEEHQNIPSNPSFSEIDSETRNKLRGDAIGDTLYSESFVVKTLIQLSDMHWSDELEEDLCFLWDSTMEEDVCNFLIKVSFPSIACTVIQNSDEVRLTEILIGILANIYCICKNASIMNDNEINTVLSVGETDDPLILIQVVRFVKAISYNAEKVPYITNSLLEQLNFILCNTVNDQLITHTLDAVSKFTVYNKVDITLLNGELIYSSCTAYQTFCKNTEKPVDIAVFTHVVQILSNLCTYINESSNEVTSNLLSSTVHNLDSFLKELRQFLYIYSDVDTLLPLEESLVYVIDVLVSVFQILKVEYCPYLFKSIAQILSILIENDYEDCDVFLELFCYFISVGSVNEVIDDFRQLKRASVVVILNRIRNSAVEYNFDYIYKIGELYEQYTEN